MCAEVNAIILRSDNWVIGYDPTFLTVNLLRLFVSIISPSIAFCTAQDFSLSTIVNGSPSRRRETEKSGR